MARAETIQSVRETGGGGHGPLPPHNTCCMELPRPLHTWPGLLTTTTISTGTLHQNHHDLHPLQSLYRYELPVETQTHQQSPALPPSPTLCNRREERPAGVVTPSTSSGEELDSHRQEHQEDSSRQGPLPDLLPQNEHPSWASMHHRAPRREAVQVLEVRRVASQLRAIGDEYNTRVLHRANAAPHWQGWRDICRGLLSFVTQTLSALYRLT